MKLLKTYEDVNSGKLSMRHAAREYGVPLSTLSDHVTGRVQFVKKGDSLSQAVSKATRTSSTVSSNSEGKQCFVCV